MQVIFFPLCTRKIESLCRGDSHEPTLQNLDEWGQESFKFVGHFQLPDKLPEIPAKYADLLTKINGLSNEGSLIFGAETGDNHCFEDIVTANRTFFRGKKSDWLLLGRDESFYFIYEPASQNYHIIDQDSFEPEMTSVDYEPLLVFLLKIE